MAGEESSRTARGNGEMVSTIPQAGEGQRDVRDPLPPEIRDPSFPVSVRGYDRHAVDGYVERVNRLIAELQISGSPKAAVRHALDRVGEQTSGILQHARQTAEEITTSAREEAEQTTDRARAEAADIVADARRQAADAAARAGAEAEETVAAARAEAEELRVRARDESDSTLARARIDAEARIRQAEEELGLRQEQAEARLRSLQADIAAVTDERRALLEDVRRIAARLSELVAETETETEAGSDETEDEPAPEA